MLNELQTGTVKRAHNYERLLQITALGSFVFGFLCFPLSVVMFFPFGESIADAISALGPLFGMMLLVSIVRIFSGSWYNTLEILEIRKISLGVGLAIPLLAFVTIIVSGVITLQWEEFAREQFNWVFDEPVTVEMGLKGSIVQMIVLSACALVAAPIFEEVLFRRVLFRVLAPRLGKIASCIIASLIFAAMHFTLLQMPGLFCMAMIWQIIYLKERNLTVTIMLHFFNNLAAVSMMLLARFLSLPLA